MGIQPRPRTVHVSYAEIMEVVIVFFLEEGVNGYKCWDGLVLRVQTSFGVNPESDAGMVRNAKFAKFLWVAFNNRGKAQAMKMLGTNNNIRPVKAGVPVTPKMCGGVRTNQCALRKNLLPVDDLLVGSVMGRNHR